MNLFLSVQSLVPASRSWDIKNADGTARDLTGLTPWLLINDAADAVPLIAEIEGTVSGSTALFSIPGLLATHTRKVFPCYLRLKSALGVLADDGQWKGYCVVDGGAMLATVEDLKTYLNINHGNNDTDLWAAVVAASKWFETQTGRSLASTSYVGDPGRRRGTGHRAQLLPGHQRVGPDHQRRGGDALDRLRRPGLLRERERHPAPGPVRVRGAGQRLGQLRRRLRDASRTTSGLPWSRSLRSCSGSGTGSGSSAKNFGGETVTYYYAPPARVVSTVEAYRWT